MCLNILTRSSRYTSNINSSISHFISIFEYRLVLCVPVCDVTFHIPGDDTITWDAYNAKMREGVVQDAYPHIQKMAFDNQYNYLETTYLNLEHAMFIFY